MRWVPVVGAMVVACVGLDCGNGRGTLLGAAHDELPDLLLEERTPPELLFASVPAAPAAGSDVPADPPVAIATTYASLSSSACATELDGRHIAHETLTRIHGVEMPVRLTGPLSGVTFRTLLPDKQRARSPYEILDCRLVLSLDDFAKQLARSDVVEVFHYSAYRPPPAGWLVGPYGLRHEGALAIDVAYFRNANGTALNVERDFGAHRGERPCLPVPTPRNATMASLALRKIVCDAFEARLFHLTLTPDYDFTHRDHFHLEVTPGATEVVVR